MRSLTQIEHVTVVLLLVALLGAAILFQHDATLRFRKLVAGFEVEQQVAPQSAPLFETYCCGWNWELKIRSEGLVNIIYQ